MKFNMIISLLCIALLLGCTQINPFEITDSNKPQNLEKNPVLTKDSVQVRDNGNVRTFTVYAQKIEGEWRFPMMNYSGEFVIGFNLSKNEQVYLTPYIKKGKGIIFNAILEQQMFACDSESVVVLGHERPVDQSVKLLGGDDRWQVQTDCNEPMHDLTSVTMNGYFSDLKDNKQVSLFGNDNTVLVWFEDLETRPVLKVVYTKPLKVKETAPLIYTNTSQEEQRDDTVGASTLVLNDSIMLAGNAYTFCDLWTTGQARTQTYFCNENGNTGFVGLLNQEVFVHGYSILITGFRPERRTQEGMKPAEVDVIITSPANTSEIKDQIYDSDSDEYYNEKQQLSQQGILIKFEPAIPMLSEYSGELIEHDSLEILIGRKRYTLAHLRAPNSNITLKIQYPAPKYYYEKNTTYRNSEIIIGNPPDNYIINECEEFNISQNSYYANVDRGRITFSPDSEECAMDYSSWGGTYNRTTGTEMHEGDILSINNRYFHLQRVNSIDVGWFTFGVYDQIINLSENEGVRHTWKNNSLESIFIPKNSSAYHELFER